MAKRSVAELDFDLSDDDGELRLTGYEEGDEFVEDEFLEDEEEVDDEEVVDDDEELEDKSSSMRVRMDNLEKTMQSLPQMIATAIASALNKGGGKEDEEEEIPDELEPRQMVNILGKRMEKFAKASVDSAMQEMKKAQENDPAWREARITAEFRGCLEKYGQKFTDRMIPVARIIQRVEKSGGKISAEDAYLSIADIPVASKTKTLPAQKVKSGKRLVRVDADSGDSVGSLEDREIRPKFDSKKMKEMSDADMFQRSWNSALIAESRRGSRRRAS